MKHLNIRVHGVVQGVCFRAYAQDKAEELGIAGFVRNERDGTVYIEAEADEQALAPFVQWCGHGPPSAIVDHADVAEGRVKGFSGFRVTG